MRLPFILIVFFFRALKVNRIYGIYLTFIKANYKQKRTLITENIVYKVRFEILFSSRDNYVRTQAENVFCDYVTDFDVVGDSEFADKIHHVEYTFFGNGG